MVTNMRIVNNGITVPISKTMSDQILAATGRRGFGMAPTQLVIREGAGQGGRHRQSKRLTRDIDFPVFFQAKTLDTAIGAAEVYTQMRQMVAVMNDNVTPARLYVVNADGTEVYLDIHLAGGADHQYGTDTNGRSWARWPITVRAPQPFWTSVESKNYAVRAGGSGRGLIKDTSLSRLRLTSSGAIGTVTVDNPGDTSSEVIWTIKGPGNSMTAMLNGRGFEYTEPILGDNPITIDTQTKKVIDSLRVNRYEDLGPAPKLFQIPPGQSKIDIEMGGADGTSEILFNFQPRFEVVF